MGYTKDAIKGFSWLGSFRVITRVISFLRTIIVARILTPSQFGLYGVASLILSLIEIFTETGINIFLTQQDDDIDKFINTAWIVSILRGVVICSAIIMSSGFVANFFHSPDSQSLLLIISIVPLARGFINPSVVKFLKNLEYQKEFLYRLSIFTVESVTTVVWVVIFKSPEGLVWGLVAGAVFEMVISFYLATPRPMLRFQSSLFKTIVSHGKWMTASGIFNYLYHNADNIVVGRMLGTASLGLYDMAYRLSMLPISEVSDVFGKVTFPVYVKIADDKKRLRRAYLRSLGVVLGLTVPIGVIGYFFSDIIIRVVLGEQWISVVHILRLLIIFGVIRAVTFTCIDPFYAAKKQQYVTAVTFISVVVMLSTVVPFIQWFGLIGAGYSALTGAIIAVPFIVYYLYKVLY